MGNCFYFQSLNIPGQVANEEWHALRILRTASRLRVHLDEKIYEKGETFFPLCLQANALPFFFHSSLPSLYFLLVSLHTTCALIVTVGCTTSCCLLQLHSYLSAQNAHLYVLFAILRKISDFLANFKVKASFREEVGFTVTSNFPPHGWY